MRALVSAISSFMLPNDDRPDAKRVLVAGVSGLREATGGVLVQKARDERLVAAPSGAAGGAASGVVGGGSQRTGAATVARFVMFAARAEESSSAPPWSPPPPWRRREDAPLALLAPRRPAEELEEVASW